MSSKILREVAKKLLEFDIVVKTEFYGTKLRVYLIKGFVLDVYYNETLRKYSYALVGENRRIFCWDNAPHHEISTFPHHFHGADGKIEPSELSGDILKDIEIVMKHVKKFISRQQFS